MIGVTSIFAIIAVYEAGNVSASRPCSFPFVQESSCEIRKINYEYVSRRHAEDEGDPGQGTDDVAEADRPDEQMEEIEQPEIDQPADSADSDKPDALLQQSSHNPFSLISSEVL